MFSIIFENFINSFESIRANKLRSALSMLGIIIWVSSVIILSAIWNGSTQSIVSQIEEIWTNVLTVSVGWWFWWTRSRATATNILDAKLVKNIKENIDWLSSVVPVINSMWQLVYWSKDMRVTVNWIENDFLKSKNLDIVAGSYFSTWNLDEMEKVAIIWQDIKSELFNWKEDHEIIWERVKMWNHIFTVVWIIKESSIYSSYMFIPITTSSIRVTWQKYYSQIIVNVTDTDKVNQKEWELNAFLEKYFNVRKSENAPYSIFNQADVLEIVSSIMWTLTVMLSWIAWISLVVWWIWVMNIMLVSVTERIKEIWIRKAIWAWKTDILLQFMTESSVLSLLWWTIWILFSYFVIYILNTYFFASYDLEAVITVWSIFLSFWFSLCIWLFFWIVPAYKAAKLRPIDALRFE